jgi:hypothetical protein
MVAATSAVEISGTYPHRVLVSVTGISVGDRVQVYRVVNGRMTAIRGGYLMSADTTALVVTDNELPFGVPVFWRTRINGHLPTFYDSNSATLNIGLPGSKVCISDAITGLSSEVVIRAWDKVSYTADNTRYKVGGKTIVVSGEGKSGQFDADIELYFAALSAKDQFFAMWNNATSGVLQLRRAVSNGWIDECYFSILDYDVERFSNEVDDERRIVRMSIAQTDPWPASFKAKGFTLQDLANLYVGKTLADLNLDYPTLLSVAQADLS